MVMGIALQLLEAEDDKRSPDTNPKINQQQSQPARGQMLNLVRRSTYNTTQSPGGRPARPGPAA